MPHNIGTTSAIIYIGGLGRQPLPLTSKGYLLYAVANTFSTTNRISIMLPLLLYHGMNLTGDLQGEPLDRPPSSNLFPYYPGHLGPFGLI
jgi:hypothetical protein